MFLCTHAPTHAPSDKSAAKTYLWGDAEKPRNGGSSRAHDALPINDAQVTNLRAALQRCNVRACKTEPTRPKQQGGQVEGAKYRRARATNSVSRALEPTSHPKGAASRAIHHLVALVNICVDEDFQKIRHRKQPDVGPPSSVPDGTAIDRVVQQPRERVLYLFGQTGAI